MDTMSGPKRRGRPVVERVFEITLEQLAEVGLERLSIPEVARRAHLNKTSIYRRWPTKAELVLAAVEDALDLSTSVPDTGSLRTDLVELTRSTGAFIESPVGLGLLRVVFGEGGGEKLGSLRKEAFVMDAAGPRRVIERAVARGELPAVDGAELLIVALAGSLVHRVLIERKSITDDFVETLVDLVLFGSLPRGDGGCHG
jgi:AcrR family transcriptional regulator